METGIAEDPPLPSIIAHRGASLDRPENTVDAFVEAVAQDADAVELDVRRSADGVLVVHHDAQLPDGRLVAAVAYDELPSTVPTLDEALDACQGLLVNVEIKNLPVDPDFDEDCTIADEVLAALDRRRALAGTAGAVEDEILVSSFHLRTIDRCRALDPTVPTALLTFIDPLPIDSVAVAVARGHVALHPHDATVDAALMAVARDAGLAVNVWTVDDPGRIRQLADLGVDGIVTNTPRLARNALAR